MGVRLERSRLLVRANLRKAKGQTVAIIVLVLLSSMMMNLWLMLSDDYKKNFDRCHNRLNDGHVNIAAYPADDRFTGFISDTLESSAEVTEFSMLDAFCAPVSFSYGGGEISQLGVLLEKEDALSRSVGKFEITEDSDIASGIYLPMLYGTGENYSVGDTVALTVLGEEVEYTVCGFFNNTMSGSHNCGLVCFLLTEDQFEEFSDRSSAIASSYISIRVKDKRESEKMEKWLKDVISERFPDFTAAGNNYQLVTTSRYISQMICAQIMKAMAVFMLLIGVVVIVSNAANYIRENMRNLGALKAVGYTSGQLILALILQFSGISAAAAAVGTVLSYCIFPVVNEMMIAQTGIPYKVKFLPLPCLATVCFILGVVAGAVYLATKKIRRLEPITAIREGIATHNFKKNHLPIEKSPLPFNLALSMKTTLSEWKQNGSICVTMLVLSLIIVFSGVMFQNVIVDMEPFINMMAGETTDCAVNVNCSREQELASALEADSRVEKFYLYTNNNTEIQHVGGDRLAISVIDDFSGLNNQEMVIEGRFPQYDNEFAVAAKYARDNGLTVGDEISLKIGSNQDNYIISGLIQLTNNLGKDCVITREGYEKISALPNVTYYIDLTEGTDIDAFSDEISGRFGSDVNAVFNFFKIIEGTGSVYVVLLTVIVIAILFISCVVIVFVMYLLVRTLLNRKRRDYGILKALGYTTGQLVRQTAMSFMPSVLISTTVGILIGMQVINPLLSVLLSGIGIVRCTFVVPIGFNVIAGTGLVLFAFAAACLMSLRIRKIVPRDLLSGE